MEERALVERVGGEEREREVDFEADMDVAFDGVMEVDLVIVKKGISEMAPK